MQMNEIEEKDVGCNRRLRKCQVRVLESVGGWCYDDHDKRYISGRSAMQTAGRKR